MILIHDGIISIRNDHLAREIADLHTAAFGFRRAHDMTEYKIKKKMKDPRFDAYGYVKNGMLVGFFYVYSHNVFSPKWLSTFCVAPWQRGRGIASIMLKYILSKYTMYAFELTVAPENTSAKGLYKKFGFNHTDKLTMRKEVE